MTQQPHINGSIEQQAADWFLLMNSDEIPNEAQLHSFLDWLENPEAEAAYADCENTWEITQELTPSDFEQQEISSPFTRALSNPHGLWKQRNSRIGLGLQAACLTLVALATLWFGNMTQNHETAIYQTAIGQQATHTLLDGTLVTLNTASEIHVSYSDDARKITLARGEVLFDVAKDKHRPFSVAAGNGKVTALGTIFNVKKSADHETIDVKLLEGRLRVSATVSDTTNQSRELTTIINANDGLSYSRQAISDTFIIHDSEKVTEWTNGRVSFTDVRLSEILDEVNRYSIDKLFIEEQSLAQEKLDAYFVIGDTEALLLALEETLNVQTSERPDGIYLSRKTLKK